MQVYQAHKSSKEHKLYNDILFQMRITFDDLITPKLA